MAYIESRMHRIDVVNDVYKNIMQKLKCDSDIIKMLKSFNLLDVFHT